MGQPIKALYLRSGVRFFQPNLDHVFESNPFYTSTFVLTEAETWCRIKCFALNQTFKDGDVLWFNILNCAVRYVITYTQRKS
jgi:hypothetical protein